MCSDVHGPSASVECDEKWNFEDALPERVLSAYKGTEMSVLLSMSGAIQRPHIGEYNIKWCWRTRVTLNR